MATFAKYQHTSSIQPDGSRPKIRPADVSGRFWTLKQWIHYPLITLFFVLPWVYWQGNRWLLIHIEKREFTLLGFEFNAQDTYLLFFLVSGLGFSLFFITALIGRVWCGYSCPQTLVMEGLFRRIERWLEGSRSEQLRLEKAAWGAKKIRIKVFKHTLFVIVSLALTATLVLYFVPQASLRDIVTQGPGSHPTLFFWILALTALFYGDFAWFREQVCVILCPYGRLQSALTDDDTVVIGYDSRRGEPRGPVSQEGVGDCVNCGRCVVVCPTGIDIRAGLQLECVGCANCIDACDEVMTKLKRPSGLIRYDSLNGLLGKPKKILRGRIYIYTILLFIGIAVASITLSRRQPFEANLLRLPGMPYVIEGETLRNQYQFHLFNKSSKPMTFRIDMPVPQGGEIILPAQTITLQGREDKVLPWMLRLPLEQFQSGMHLEAKISVDGQSGVDSVRVPVLGPKLEKP